MDKSTAKQQPMNPNPDPGTGNASNPSPKNTSLPSSNQLIPEEGEKYLREVSSPEDYVDPEQSGEEEES